jgi:Uma2 family endonuclease
MSIVATKNFTVREYHQLEELGFLNQTDHVELIQGEIVQMSPKGTAHSVCETLLYKELLRILGDLAIVRGQQPITISDHSEPEPDLAIVQNIEDNYLSAHPSPDDILCLIEIANSSLKYDQEVKLSLYAAAGITDYWIFNLIDNYLESYNQPYKDLQGKFGYRRRLIFLPNESVNLPFFSDLILDLSKVFP